MRPSLGNLIRLYPKTDFSRYRRSRGTPHGIRKQVVDLWDSVFRGLPLGAFMLQKREDGRQGHPFGTDARNDELPRGWDLLDGQQRVCTLLLGLYGFNLKDGTKDARCIWIDLGDENPDHGFKLYVTSASQPFGYGDSGYKLSPNDRQAARSKYEPDRAQIMTTGTTGPRRAFTHELFEKFLNTRSGLRSF